MKFNDFANDLLFRRAILAIGLTVVVIASLMLLSASAGADPAPSVPTLYLIGDLTVHNPMTGLKGWGDVIASKFDVTKINVENHAIGGRSSRTYFTEGHWDEVVKLLKPGDFVMMQFGHNDGGPVVGGTNRASLKGDGEDTQVIVDPKTNLPETVHTYGWYLRKYITDAKSKGATVFVCSMISEEYLEARRHGLTRCSGLRRLGEAGSFRSRSDLHRPERHCRPALRRCRASNGHRHLLSARTHAHDACRSRTERLQRR